MFSVTSVRNMTWRRRKSFFDSMFDDTWGIDDWAERMFDNLRNIDPSKLPENTYYYGFQLTQGPDGKPVIREFGNVKPFTRGRLEVGARQPLVDVSVDEKEGTVKIVAEMPGADKESIGVNAAEDHVSITSNQGGKPYKAEVPLSVKIDPDTAEASYNNGILEIIIKQKAPEKKGTSVKVK
jgi:HSP20 family protein